MSDLDNKIFNIEDDQFTAYKSYWHAMEDPDADIMVLKCELNRCLALDDIHAKNLRKTTLEELIKSL